MPGCRPPVSRTRAALGPCARAIRSLGVRVAAHRLPDRSADPGAAPRRTSMTRRAVSGVDRAAAAASITLRAEPDRAQVRGLAAAPRSSAQVTLSTVSGRRRARCRASATTSASTSSASCCSNPTSVLAWYHGNPGRELAPARGGAVCRCTTSSRVAPRRRAARARARRRTARPRRSGPRARGQRLRDEIAALRAHHRSSEPVLGVLSGLEQSADDLERTAHRQRRHRDCCGGRNAFAGLAPLVRSCRPSRSSPRNPHVMPSAREDPDSRLGPEARCRAVRLFAGLAALPDARGRAPELVATRCPATSSRGRAAHRRGGARRCVRRSTRCAAERRTRP